MIPGSNLLNQALSLIAKQEFGHIKFNGRTTNAIGLDVTTYDDEVTLSGSVQAVPKTVYQHLGLDWKKTYINIYNTTLINGVGRDTSGDKVTFSGRTYQVMPDTDWRSIDGWSGVMCVGIT